jgi:hypothetical protein
MPRAELATTDHQTPNNGQNASTNQKKKVTLELRKYILLLASLVATVVRLISPLMSPTAH